VTYAFSDNIKIIDFGRRSKSVITSTVDPTIATVGLLVFTTTKLSYSFCTAKHTATYSLN